MTATSPATSFSGSPSSGVTQASPATIEATLSGASSWMRSDHGVSITDLSTNAPRARGVRPTIRLVNP